MLKRFWKFRLFFHIILRINIAWSVFLEIDHDIRFCLVRNAWLCLKRRLRAIMLVYAILLFMELKWVIYTMNNIFICRSQLLHLEFLCWPVAWTFLYMFDFRIGKDKEAKNWWNGWLGDLLMACFRISEIRLGGGQFY